MFNKEKKYVVFISDTPIVVTADAPSTAITIATTWWERSGKHKICNVRVLEVFHEVK